MKTLLATLLVALLTGCASTPFIDRSLSAKGQSSRVKFIIVHYTVSDLPQSIKILTEQTVSSHYLLTDEQEPKIYQLVDETRQANHAGVSNWKNYTLLNGSSVGIEIVNKGFTEGPDGRIWYPFPQPQVDKLIVLLKEIVARHGVPPENILGHSDIAPQRKQDPGPLFPWYQLAQHGLITWPDPLKVSAAKEAFGQQAPDVAWFQKKLATHGYAVPQNGEYDEATKNVLTAFQMKYRPLIIDGTPDIETAALLEALTAVTPKP
ncbi:MAG: N-acetylmuramoyl-L-alanine amidase [Pseudomonadota bacterium]